MIQQTIKLSLLASLSLGIFSCGDSASENKEKQVVAAIKYIDYSNMDTTVAPGDDFFRYANGQWLDKTKIPGDKTRWGSFDELIQKTNEHVKILLEEAVSSKEKAGSIKGNVGAFYKSGMDTLSIEKAGISPLKPYLDEINTLTSNEQLVKHLASNFAKGIHTVFTGYIFADEKDVTNNILQFSQAGLGLPTKDYYFKTDSLSVKNRAAYIAYLTNLFKLNGATPEDASLKANTVFQLETKLATASLSPVEMRDPNKLYNKYAPAQLTTLTGIDWNTFITGLGATKGYDSLIIATPKYYKALGGLLKSENIQVWKDYLTVHLISDMAPYLSSAFSNARFEFYGQTLSGQEQQKPRWERVTGVINNAIGDQLGKLYVDAYFQAAAKERMVELVNNLQGAFHERITHLDWMSDATKNKAIAKLNTFIKKIGYPDKWKTYEGLEILDNNYVQNVINTSIFEHKRSLAKLGVPVDKTEWLMSPNTVNAYYNPVFNEIVFPAAILQFPFFDFQADDAINYGGIGAVIGHEMTHGFDDQGCQYDAAGYLKNWWLPEDAKLFAARTTTVINQFDLYTVLNGSVHVNGALTLGENIADLGGVAIAYEAFKKTKQGQSQEKIDGFTPDQRFFLSWAQIWRNKATDAMARQLIETDSHAPGEWRCNGPLSNFEPFYKAFNVTEGNKMFVPVEKRAKIW